MQYQENGTAYFFMLNSAQKDLCICHLSDNFYESARKVYIYCASKEHSESIDRALWVFKQSSFIPHEIVNEYTVKIESDILIGSAAVNKFESEILIISGEISEESAGFIKSFQTIIDFADQYDDLLLEKSRKRYALINKLGFNMVFEKRLPANLK